jgi:GNAT superfamily N-acetyltransferase
VIRRARVEDAEAIAGVHVRGWQAAYAGVFPAERLARLSVAERAARRREWLEASPARAATLVVEHEDRIAGFAGLGPSRDGAEDGELYAIYVEPALQRRGLGRALLARAEAELRRLGFAEATLWVLEGNDAARRFYERAGWDADGARRTVTILETNVSEVRYRRSTRTPPPSA